MAQTIFRAGVRADGTRSDVEDRRIEFESMRWKALNEVTFKIHGWPLGRLTIISPTAHDFLTRVHDQGFDWEMLVSFDPALANYGGNAWAAAMSAIWRDDAYCFMVTDATSMLGTWKNSNRGQRLAIFKTDHRDIGVCPQEAREGDELWASCNTEGALAIIRAQSSTPVKNGVTGRALVSQDGLVRKWAASGMGSWALPAPEPNIAREATRKSRA